MSDPSWPAWFGASHVHHFHHFPHCEPAPARPEPAGVPQILAAIRDLKETILAELDDLNTAEGRIETDLAANKALLTQVRDELTAALANAGPSGVDAAGVQAVIDKLNAAAGGLESDDASGDGQTPPPPAQ